jgi:hypothetical protein
MRVDFSLLTPGRLPGRSNADASQAVDEFNAALEGVRAKLEQQKTWLVDENKRLDDMRRM